MCSGASMPRSPSSVSRFAKCELCVPDHTGGGWRLKVGGGGLAAPLLRGEHLFDPRERVPDLRARGKVVGSLPRTIELIDAVKTNDRGAESCTRLFQIAVHGKTEDVLQHRLSHRR